MLRRDYILRMIQEIAEALQRVSALRKNQELREATVVVDEEFKRLIGAGPEEIVKLSDTELLAKLLQDGPSQIVRHKALLLTALLKEAADMAEAAGRSEESRAYYLKGLHLLLDVLGSNEVDECPEFVPKVDFFVQALRDSPLPIRTQALLMQHFERTGQWARAEDALFGILDAQPENGEALDFGIAFYERLKNRSDTALAEGDLPRAEVEAGLAELRQRKAA